MKSCTSEPVRDIAILVFSAIVLFSGCVHHTHPSNVRPGWSAEIVGGVGEEHYRIGAACNGCRGDEPASGSVNVIQTNLAWGKTLEGGKALRAGLMIPLAMNNGSALGAVGGTTLDIYYQFLKGPINAGAGGMAGLVNSGAYLQAGKTLSLSDECELDIDVGASAEIALFNEPGVRPFFLVGCSRKGWKAGIWADYLKYADYLKRCDENCEADDFLERSASGGMFVGKSF